MMTAKTTKAPTVPTAIEAAEQQLEQIRAARLAGGKATAMAAAAEAEARDAETALERAADARVRGEADADERHRGASVRIQAAAEQRATAHAEYAAADRVLRSAQTRLAQLRENFLPEFQTEAETYVADAQRAAEALAEPLARYIEAWDLARTKWNVLHPAIVAMREQSDLERDVPAIRGSSQVSREATCPECPVDPVTVGRIRSLAARPRAVTPGFDPFSPAQPVHVEPVQGEDGPFVFDSQLIAQA